MKNQLCRIALSGLLATGLTLCSAAAFAQQDNPRTRCFNPATGERSRSMGPPADGLQMNRLRA